VLPALDLAGVVRDTRLITHSDGHLPYRQGVNPIMEHITGRNWWPNCHRGLRTDRRRWWRPTVETDGSRGTRRRSSALRSNSRIEVGWGTRE
jgi:hypothetical protein